MKVRIEVLVQFVVAVAFALAWFFIPIWSLVSNIYRQELTPLGFSIVFLNYRYFLFLPTTLASFIYALASAVIPIVWRRSRYSLYLSVVTLLLSVMLLVTALIFQSRYLFYGGYSILDSATGYVYIKIPYKTYFDLPFYILIALIAITVVNAATRAHWVRFKRETLIEEIMMKTRVEGPVTALKSALDRIGIQYTDNAGALMVEDLAITGKPISELPSGVREYVAFTETKSLYFDGSLIKELSIEEGVLLALSRALIKGKPGKVGEPEYV